jgi:lipopolysaccharide biosynthesis glycosyltransferase
MTGLQVACAADEAYVPHSAAMLHSVLVHGGSDIQVHYLHGPAFPVESQHLLREMVERNGGSIAFLCIPDEDVAGLPGMAYITVPMWYRIFLPELLPHVDRVLYLDVDTVAVDSLDELWRTELTDCFVAAVTNVFMRQDASHPSALGLGGERAYFNSGVLLMNLDEMRRHGCSRSLRELALTQGSKLDWPDQDALNLVLGGRRRPLHPRWNCMNSVLNFPWSANVFGAGAVEEARRRPGIRHFEGPALNKPWHYLCERTGRELYLAHRLQTPWPELRMEGATPAAVVKRWTRDARRRIADARSRGDETVSA